MRLDFVGERILAVVAHPDDAELFCAGTLARAKANGAAVGICVLCSGDKGQPAEPVANLAAVRRNEMTAAAALLGAELFPAGFPDAELADAVAERRKLMSVYREFVPTLVLTHSPDDYHPDHRATAALAEAVSWFATSRGQLTREPPLANQPALWWMDTLGMTDFEPGFFIDIGKYTDLKHRMMRCHKTQLVRGKDGEFGKLEEMMRRQYETRGAQAGVTAAEAFCIHRAFKRARAW